MGLIPWERREKMYEDVREFLDPGFLTNTFVFGDTRISLRSMFPRDQFLLQHQVATNWDWRVWLVATSIWMVNGIYVMGDVDILPDLVDFLNRTNATTINILFHCALGFFNRFKRAARFLEPYLYEEESRKVWHTNGRGSFSGSVASGLPGVESLGRNVIQSGWAGWNVTEDERHQADYQWSLVKTSLGPHAPKAVHKLDSSDRSRKLNETDHRNSVIEKYWLIYTGVLNEDGKSVSGEPRQEIIRARTPDELSEEMRRWVTGEEDSHDKVVSGYKRRIREQFVAEQKAREEAIRQAQEETKKLEESLGVKAPSVVGYTPDQIQEIIARRGPPGVRTIVESDKAKTIYERYIQSDPSAGNLVVRQGQVVDLKQPGAGSEDRLNQLLAHRRVTLK